MAEETEEKQGSRIPGLLGAVATGAGVGTVLYNREGNSLVQAARDGKILEGKQGKALEAAQATVTAVNKGIHEAPELRTKNVAVTALKKPENITAMSSATFSKSAEGKGFIGKFINDQGHSAILTDIKSLPKDVKIEGAAVTLQGDALAAIKQGEKSWVSKTVAKAETQVNKGVRNSAAFKEAGGTFKNLTLGGKAKVGGLAILAATVVGVAVNAVFGGKHTTKATQEPALEAAPAR